MMPLVEWSAGLLPETVSEHLDFEPEDEEGGAEEDEKEKESGQA